MSNSEQRDPNEIGVLWVKESKKGTKYMSGKINGQNVVIFKNKDKKTDKHPDYRVLLSTPKPIEEKGPDF